MTSFFTSTLALCRLWEWCCLTCHYLVDTFAIVIQLIFYFKNVINNVILFIQILYIYNVKCFFSLLYFSTQVLNLKKWHFKKEFAQRLFLFKIYKSEQFLLHLLHFQAILSNWNIFKIQSWHIFGFWQKHKLMHTIIISEQMIYEINLVDYFTDNNKCPPLNYIQK